MTEFFSYEYMINIFIIMKDAHVHMSQNQLKLFFLNSLIRVYLEKTDMCIT